MRLDSAKARDRLGWKPVLGLDEALAWSMQWYRAHAEAPRRAAALCREQIGRFMERSG